MSKFIEIVTTDGKDVLINLDHVLDVSRIIDYTKGMAIPTDDAYITLGSQVGEGYYYTAPHYSGIVRMIMEATK